MSRRSPGEGTVYQRSDGKWVATISGGKTVDGRRKRIKRVRDTKREAERVRRDLLARREAGITNSHKRHSVMSLYQHWIAHHLPATLKPKTIGSYSQAMNYYVLPHIGTVYLEDLTATHIEDLQNLLLNKGYSVNTVRGARRTLCSALTYAVKRRFIAYNPVKQTSAPAFIDGRPEPEVLTLDQTHQLLETCRDYPDVVIAAATTLGITLGMRRGEIFGLRLSDIDDQRLHIRQTLSEVSTPAADHEWLYSTQISTPKTRHSRRSLHLPSLPHDAIRRTIADRTRRRHEAKDPWEPSDLLFVSAVGTAVGQSSIRLRYKKLLATAGVPSITFHELRHSFAVLGLLNDIPIEQIQEAVGHSSIQTTKDIYANHLPDLAVKAVTALNDILDPQPEGRQLKIVASNNHRN